MQIQYSIIRKFRYEHITTQALIHMAKTDHQAWHNYETKTAMQGAGYECTDEEESINKSKKK